LAKGHAPLNRVLAATITHDTSRPPAPTFGPVLAVASPACSRPVIQDHIEPERTTRALKPERKSDGPRMLAKRVLRGMRDDTQRCCLSFTETRPEGCGNEKMPMRDEEGLPCPLIQLTPWAH
jgi:hypothetical protein